MKNIYSQVRLAEYQKLQQEVIERSKILHNILNLAIILSFIFLTILIILSSFSVNQKLIQWYLLSIPLLFAFLTFNYQANGFTLEVILRYNQRIFEEDFKEVDIQSWRPYYLEHKAKERLIAFTKILPLIVPQLAPILIIASGMLNISGGVPPAIAFNQISLNSFMLILFIFDIILLGLSLLNFRYKLRYLRLR